MYAQNSNVTDNFVSVGGTLVFPSYYSACVDLWFVCPGNEFVDAAPWTYQCPSNNQNGARRRTSATNAEENDTFRRNLGTGSQQQRPYYTKESAGKNSFPQHFHHLIDSSKQFYTLLPSDSKFCLNGGTIIHSGDTPLKDCASRTLLFEKAGNRRPLPGGTSVANEWFPNLGIKISASSDGGPDNMHPIIFDMASPNSNGVDPYKASLLGSHDELGNVLVPLRQAGVNGPPDDYGILNFDFYYKTLLNYVSVLNADSSSNLTVTQANGTVSVYGMQSAGSGAVQMLQLDMENVVRLSVSFKTFAAVVSLDMCIVRK